MGDDSFMWIFSRSLVSNQICYTYFDYRCTQYQIISKFVCKNRPFGKKDFVRTFHDYEKIIRLLIIVFNIECEGSGLIDNGFRLDKTNEGLAANETIGVSRNTHHLRS